ncbi:MAG: FxsA family protein [Thiotrichaceae bacterium]
MKPFPILAILFLVVPLVELYFLIKVGESIGVWSTIFLVVFTAFLGVTLLRQQGLSTLGRFQKSMMEGKTPAGEMLEGVFLLLGGGMLLLPGFLTDIIGFLCLIPFTRQLLSKFLLRNSSLQMHSAMSGGAGFGANRTPVDENVIDGEFVRRNDDRLNH